MNQSRLIEISEQVASEDPLLAQAKREEQEKQKQLEAIALEAWKRLPETQMFLKNIEKERQGLMLNACSLAMAANTDKDQVIKLLVAAGEINTIITNINENPNIIK